jgi:hypothetical protein
MPEPTFSIVNESSPQRCEICHQTDFFDPATNSCARCHNVSVTPRGTVRVELNRMNDWERAAYFRQLNERMRENQSRFGEDDSPMNANPLLIASGKLFWLGMFVVGILGLIFLSVVFQDPASGKIKYVILTALFSGGFLLALYLLGVFSPRTPPSSREKFTRHDQ